MFAARAVMTMTSSSHPVTSTSRRPSSYQSNTDLLTPSSLRLTSVINHHEPQSQLPTQPTINHQAASQSHHPLLFSDDITKGYHLYWPQLQASLWKPGARGVTEGIFDGRRTARVRNSYRICCFFMYRCISDWRGVSRRFTYRGSESAYDAWGAWVVVFF